MEAKENDNFFLDFLKKLFALFEGKEMTAEEENDAFVSLGDTDAEKAAIRQLCEEIDTSNEEMEEWFKAGEPEPGQRLVEEITKLAKENNPEISEDELDTIPTLVEEALDDAIINESAEVAGEIAGRPMTEDEISTIKAKEE